MLNFHSWSEYLQQQAVAAGKEPCVLNLDETAVSMASTNSIGLKVGKRWWPNSKIRPHQKVPLGKRRRLVTHCCISVGDSSLQPELPQVFIGNHKCFSPADVATVQAEPIGNVQFWRKKSSWNTSELMCEILTEVSKVFEKHPGKQAILALDCAPIHITRKVAQKAHDLGIWLLVIPAKCTWLLQPLDCFTFSPYKAYLKNLYRSSKDGTGKVSDICMLRNFVKLSKSFLNSRKWERSFLGTGLLGDRSNLTRDLKALGVPPSSPPTKPVLPPPKAVLEGLFPANRKVHYDLLVHKGIHQRKRRLVVS